MVIAETNKEKIRVKTGRKTMKFEEGIRTSTDGLMPKECLKEKERNIERRRDCNEREEY